LNNRDYINICKFCENEDFEGFLSVIKPLIPEFDDLTIVDKAYVLIFYRSLFIGHVIVVMNEEKARVSVDLNSVLENLAEMPCEGITDEYEGFKIRFGPIKSLADDDIYECIAEIEYNGKVVAGGDIKDVLEFLPVEVYTRINQQILDFYQYYNRVEIIPANEAAKLEALIINLHDSSFVQFVMSLYKTDLSSLFEEVYVFAQHFKNVDYFKLSPLDSKILTGILHREMSEAKKASEQTNDFQNPLTPQIQ
jgi:hypothetical protein